MLRAGTHAAVVVPMHTDFGELACQFGKAGTGTQQVLVMFEILRGPCAGDKISWFGYFTDGTIQRTLESLRICGFTGEDLDKFCDQRPTNEVALVVGEEEYQGKARLKVMWINDPNRAGIKMADPLRDGDLRKFSAQFKSKLKAMPAVKTTEAKREPPSAAGEQDDRGDVPPDDSDFGRSRPVDDSDIPF